FLRDGCVVLVGNRAWAPGPSGIWGRGRLSLRHGGPWRGAWSAPDRLSTGMVCAVSRASPDGTYGTRGSTTRGPPDVDSRRSRVRRRRALSARRLAAPVRPAVAIQTRARAEAFWYPMTTRTGIAGVAVPLVLLLAAACGRQSGRPGGGRGPQQASVPGAPPTMHLVSAVSTGEWRMPAGDYGNLRYSTLDTIKTTNVMNLQVITTFSTGVAHGHEGQPLVFGNTMYVVTPFPNNLIAVDLTKPGGAVKWIYEPHPDQDAVGIACCDVVNRGASYGDGKIVYSLLDATVVAVDAETGKEIWRTRVGDINRGETF